MIFEPDINFVAFLFILLPQLWLCASQRTVHCQVEGKLQVDCVFMYLYVILFLLASAVYTISYFLPLGFSLQA